MGSSRTGRLAAPQDRRFAALASPNFRNIWIGFLMTNTGAQMQVIATFTDVPSSLAIMAGVLLLISLGAESRLRWSSGEAVMMSGAKHS